MDGAAGVAKKKSMSHCSCEYLRSVAEGQTDLRKKRMKRWKRYYLGAQGTKDDLLVQQTSV